MKNDMSYVKLFFKQRKFIIQELHILTDIDAIYEKFKKKYIKESGYTNVTFRKHIKKYLRNEYLKYAQKIILLRYEDVISLLINEQGLSIKDAYQILLEANLLFMQGYRPKTNIGIEEFEKFIKNNSILKSTKTEGIKARSIKNTPIPEQESEKAKQNTTNKEKTSESIQEETQIESYVEDEDLESPEEHVDGNLDDADKEYIKYEYYQEDEGILNAVKALLPEEELVTLEGEKESWLLKFPIVEFHHSKIVLEKRFFYFDVKHIEEQFYEKIKERGYFKNYDLIAFRFNEDRLIKFFRYYDDSLVELDHTYGTTDFDARPSLLRGIKNVEAYMTECDMWYEGKYKY